MAQNPAQATAILLDACSDALQLLNKLNGDAKVGKPVNQFLVNKCDAMVFTWTIKAGVGLGVSAGGGFIIVKLEGGKWSAPCFLKLATGQAGAIFGVEKVGTIMAATDRSTVREIVAGRSPVVGSDLSIQIWPLVKGAPSDAVQSLAEAWNTTNLVSFTYGEGFIVDYSFKGGAMSVHVARNAEVYGAEVAPEAILKGQVKAPSELLPLYNKLTEIAAGADGGVPLPASA